MELTQQLLAVTIWNQINNHTEIVLVDFIAIPRTADPQLISRVYLINH
jgi:hypothetical protein